MTKIRIIGRVLPALAVLVAAGCQTTQVEDPQEPVVRTVEVLVPQPVPCPALADLGPEPEYPDTDEALANAPSLGVLAQLYRKGRLMRNQRLMEYAAAAAGCQF